MNHDYPLDDIDEPKVTADDVQRRVDDWLCRLDQLFDGIKDWAEQHGWTVSEGTVPMNEEPMQAVGIRPRGQPVVTLKNQTGAVVYVKPKGLWVIGANGRVDLYSPKGVFVLVDVAEPFQLPRWILHKVGSGMQKGRSFEPEMIANLV